jgi:predicted TIM-barrel fold metal-dependent hydrolase
MFDHRLNPWPRKVYENLRRPAMDGRKAAATQASDTKSKAGGLDVTARIKDMDAAGTDIQFLFPTQISITSLNEGALGAALCRAYNDWLFGLVKNAQDRLWPVAAIPWGDPESMVPELRRCVKELGFRAAHVASYTFSRMIDDPAFEPFYAEAAKLNVPLMVHPPTYAELANRFDNPFQMHVLGRPFNCATALTALVIGGVFERHPRLRAAFFECTAEWILYWMHRMDDDYETHKDGFAPNISRQPSYYIRKHCYVTCEVDECDLRYAVDHFSEDNVLLATDYPHFDATTGIVTALNARTDITTKQKEKIASHNAEAFVAG